MVLTMLKNTTNSNKGQGVLEYIIISCLVGICCLMAVKKFGTVLETRIDYMKRQITENITMD